eukprot:CAMPEP_0180653672 /NCGR_PEP_ID=MMETSP1037_2-20121125/54229_1 /TAXON_ID=632150 /ORGANISM="Azadinium spinosum, Strain 3D9" /LENGTH=30 /DNA_ID= /DNA_START= /DNA_END= /DNA_ORIENTATION=
MSQIGGLPPASPTSWRSTAEAGGDPGGRHR